jgi:hypothetical protein
MPPLSPSDRVVILGAGATVGASFADGATVRPPLNADFFTQLQRVGQKHRAIAKAVIADVVELFGPNFTLTLEDYFTQLESMIDATRFSPKKLAPITASDLRDRRARLMKGLSAVLEASTDDAIRVGDGCTHHRALVDHLRPRDTVVSFNYDCVMDHALRTHGAGKWTARYGYAFPQPSRVAADLHGSLNWLLPVSDGEPIVLKQRLHMQRGTPRFTIIPPGWSKQDRDQPIFEDLWKKAERALRSAKVIAIAGFSFTPTDLHVEAVMRLALARSNSLRLLVIANPSREHRERIRAIFSRRLAGNVLVRQYDYFKEFTDALPDCMNS